MNAERGIEQLIAEWLVEDAAPGAPDRVLDSTRVAIARTNQRRFAAIWRESMFTPARLAAIAAMLGLALGAGTWIGRATAPIGPAAPASTPSPTVGATGSSATIDTYRAARRDICVRYTRQIEPLKGNLGGLFDEATSPADRTSKIASLTSIVSLTESMTGELAALEPPAELAAAHAANVARYQDITGLLRQVLVLLGQGNLAAAQAIDQSTDSISADIAAYEADNILSPCP